MDYKFTPRNVLPNGLTLLQQNPDCAAKLDPTAKDHGWLYTRRAETDWRWVTLRKLSDAEINEANGGAVCRVTANALAQASGAKEVEETTGGCTASPGAMGSTIPLNHGEKA